MGEQVAAGGLDKTRVKAIYFELGSVLYNIYTYLENYIRKMKTSNIYLIKTSKNLKKKFFNKIVSWNVTLGRKRYSARDRVRGKAIKSAGWMPWH